MKELLPLFKNPTHYVGCELNSVHKPKDIPLKWGLAFPDLYPVGVSYFGHQILYNILNTHPRIWAQRVYAPSKEVGEILRQNNVPLATLEGDIPLKELDILGFSITHELCYTTVLYMLDLANIPLYSSKRDNGTYPLIIAGGEGILNPIPMEDFFDALVIGDGEDVVLEISELLLGAKEKDIPRIEILKALSHIKGVYVPSISTGPIKRRLYSAFHPEAFPVKQVVPFGRPIHDRYVIEIAKGCTRGCRFCFAGSVNRPVRERDISTIREVLNKGLDITGYEEVNLLSLSVGDFSLLNELFSVVLTRCNRDNISLSLPSLRAGSIPHSLIQYLGKFKKTGLTLAPEAGTQRLRDVINKGITEEDILNHAKWAFENGWQKIKLYFMIGLPTEEVEDLDGILRLCLKILDMAPKGMKRISITASISPFVPKPHTPFQWERQNNLKEIKDKIFHLKRIFRPYKRIRLNWPMLEMSIIEGIFARGEKILTKAIEEAYLRGDVFTSWKEHFDFRLWLQVFESLGIDYKKYLGPRELNKKMDWDFIDIGVSKDFLEKEMEKARSEKITLDCRWGRCVKCGACDFKEIKPLINSRQKHEHNISHLITHNTKEIVEGRFSYMLWFEKTHYASYLSQLELQKVLERIMRRARLPLYFSKGYSPRPKMSFGRALPVGLWSLNEYVLIQVQKRLDPDIIGVLNKFSIHGIKFTKLEFIEQDKKVPMSVKEVFEIQFLRDKRSYIEHFSSLDIDNVVIEKKDKTFLLKDVILDFNIDKDRVKMVFDWARVYINPLLIIRKIWPDIKMLDFCLVKQQQFFK